MGIDICTLCTTHSHGWDPPTQVGPTHVSGYAQPVVQQAFP
jgi:hypothetical protein